MAAGSGSDGVLPASDVAAAWVHLPQPDGSVWRELQVAMLGVYKP